MRRSLPSSQLGPRRRSGAGALRRSLDVSIGEVKRVRSHLSVIGWSHILVAFLSSTVFFFRRDLVAAKVLAIVPLVGAVYSFRMNQSVKKELFTLGVALALHCLGDVVIKVVGVIPSMAPFLAGHFAYCVCFLRSSRVSLRGFRALHPAKKVAFFVSIVYSLGMSSLLYPEFPPVLLPVLGSYVLAITCMFVLSLFSGSVLIFLGSLLYLTSDSLIALAAFVVPENAVAVFLDENLAWPLYWAGQCMITLGVLNTFSKLELTPSRKSDPLAQLLVVGVSLVLSFISLKRVFQE